MDKFSLDLVRDSFSQDIRSVLDRAEQATSTMLSAPVFTQTVLLKEDDMPIFERMGHHFHAIYGSSALLQVKSLSESARLLEDVAQAGDECFKELDRQIRRARAFAEICVEGIKSLRDMLDLELNNKGKKAWELASNLLEKTAAREELAEVKPGKGEKKGKKDRDKDKEEPKVEKSEEKQPTMDLPPAPADAPSADAEFSFESEAPAPPPPPPAVPAAESQEFSFDDSTNVPEEPKVGTGTSVTAPEIEHIQAELLEVFQQETREALVALQGYLQTLQKNAEDMQAAKSLERIYHTLKGTSATVGLMSLSSIAADLQDSMERVLEGVEKVDAPFMKSLIERTNGLLRAGGMPEISIEPAEAAPKAQESSEELRKIFHEEAEGICRQADKLLGQIADAKVDRATRAAARQEVGALFHRLKGSAVLNGLQEVADEAARLQELAQSSGEEDPMGRDLDAGLKKIFSLLGLKPGAARPAPAPKAKSATEPAAAAAPSREREKFQAVREQINTRIEPELWEAFEIESTELIDAIQKNVFALEESTQPKTVLYELFRTFHTLKGAANTTGLSPVGKIVHLVEDLLEELTEASILPPMKMLTNFLLKILEGVRKNLREARKGYVETNIKQVEVDIARVRAGKELPMTTTDTASEHATESHPSTMTDEGSKSGTRTGTKGTDEGEIARTGQSATEKYIRVATERLDGLMNLAGELVVSRSRLNRRVAALRSMQRDLINSRGRLLGMVEGFRERYEFSNLEGRKRMAGLVAAGRGRGEGGSAASGFTDLEMDKYEDINILARSLREVSDDISELQKQIHITIDNFTEDSDSFSALVSSLQDEITRARMVPIDQLFMRLRLPIRDAGEREKKEVRVVTVGEEVNLDKTIVDSLYLPMLHLVRNSVSHGIESRDRRVASGKDPVGTVTLSARQVSGQIVIEASDDGGGLNLESLRSKGVSLGLIPADTPVDSPVVRELIFMSGVSTRETAGDVAGRGMGLTVVRRELEKLNGNIRVHSERGRGTTFVITLPLTLAISRALLVRNRGRLYAVPLHFAQRILDLGTSKVMESAEVRRIRIDDEYLSLHGLTEILKIQGAAHQQEGEDDPNKGTALLLRVGDDRAVVRVDAVVAQDEIVVKTMGDLLQGHPLFSGVTISGDGDLILIIDVPGLLESLGGSTSSIAATPSMQKIHATAEAAGAEDSAQPMEDRPIRVLFVDDSLSVRKVAEKFLTTAGAEVTLAVDGVDALAKLRGGMFDMVFTDLEMPRMHGYEFIREMRYIPQFKEIPVVVVTSRSGAKHRTQAQLVGATDYVTKPFTQAILQEKLDTYVRNKK